jgi:PPM family protein phosphatase
MECNRKCEANGRKTGGSVWSAGIPPAKIAESTPLLFLIHAAATVALPACSKLHLSKGIPLDPELKNSMMNEYSYRSGRLLIECSARSDQGMVRASNEDSFIADSQSNTFLVADGMGGHAAGEVASQIAASTVSELLSERNPKSNMEDVLRLAVQEANARVFETQRLKPEYRGMGSTLTVLICQADRYFLAHVGDSRAYRFRDSHLHQLTSDHSFVWPLYEKKLLTKKEISHHPKKNLITRSIGTQPEIEVDLQSDALLQGDVFLLCSDGLTDVLSDEDIQQILSSGGKNPQEISEKLIKTANSGGGPDNITVVVICIHS